MDSQPITSFGQSVLALLSSCLFGERILSATLQLVQHVRCGQRNLLKTLGRLFFGTVISPERACSLGRLSHTATAVGMLR